MTEESALCRSKKETERLHKLHKPVRQARATDDLPSLDSHSEEESEVWSSGLEEDENDASSNELSSDDEADKSGLDEVDNSDSDAEMPYEAGPRHRRPLWDEEDEKLDIPHLPTKTKDGRIEKSKSKPTVLPNSHNNALKPDPASSSESEGSPDPAEEKSRIEDVSTGARFGRLAVVDIVANKSRKARIHGAKEQLASICQDIIADPENSVRMLPFHERTDAHLLYRLDYYGAYIHSHSPPSPLHPIPNQLPTMP